MSETFAESDTRLPSDCDTWLAMGVDNLPGNAGKQRHNTGTDHEDEKTGRETAPAHVIPQARVSVAARVDTKR